MSASPLDNNPNDSTIEQKPSLMQRVIRGSAWTIGGHAASQVIRLGSNLLLSRLLFPEAFGLMALVFTFITGLHMLSDFGVQPNIIQSKRG
ncbi:MAG: oligosaccharide flippase family protein, partial [Leptolyngbyaceae cyanobacterium bins.302]|nr:oligosaccharide flippase family protein [Leptolyngbyaceae cyanobacterium bins.302]